MSEGAASLQPTPLPDRENSIYHFRALVSLVTSPIARGAAQLTRTIDETKAGAASRGPGWR